MDTKTLIIVALLVALAITLTMAVILWTRRTYPGFGYWVAGVTCGCLASVLFLLPRDQFPPWLTIVLANYLLLAKAILFCAAHSSSVAYHPSPAGISPAL